MPQEFLDLLKEYGLDWATLTAEQRTKAQQIWDNHQKQKNPNPPKQDTKPNDGTSALSDADRERLQKLETGLKDLGTALKSVTDFVNSQNQSAAERAKAERETRYKTAVEKAVTDRRLTRAKADEYLKPEAMEGNLAGLEVFEKMLGDMPVDKALGTGPDKTEQPEKPGALAGKPIADLREAAREAASARFKQDA